jgi:hypothetical protein
MMLARLTSIPIPYIVSAVAIAVVVALAVAHELSPTPVVPVTVRAEQFPVAPKADEPVDVPLSHAVRTVPITPVDDGQAAIAAAVTALPVPQEALQQRPAKATLVRDRAGADICARHGCQRVDEGRRWRCDCRKREGR